MQQTNDFRSSLYRRIASLKLTVFIFLALAVGSIIGTLLPQGLSQQDLLDHYGPNLYRWINFFRLDDLYHSGWFRFLMILLCVNLVACSLHRFPKTLKLVRHRDRQLNPEKLEKFNFSAQFQTGLPWDEIKPRLEAVIRQEFAPVQPLSFSGIYGGMAEKGRWSPLMVYVVHLSVIIILLGALVGSIFGFKGVMNIHEGEASGKVVSFSEQRFIDLPFQVRCDDFEASFYEETGAPKDYRSDLTILKDGKEVLKRSIRVNDPMTYQGITFYQSSYGSSLESAVVEFQDTQSGKSNQVTLSLNETQTIPGTEDDVRIFQYQQNFSQFGRALAIGVLREGKEPTGSWILADKPDFHGNKIENYRVKIVSLKESEYTGLQVKKDQGVWIVWLGFIAMIIGIGAAFYSTHRKIWVWAEEANPSVEIRIAGRTNKNSLAFEREFNHLCEHLQNELNRGKGNESL